jgi:hypothetical protein
MNTRYDSSSSRIARLASIFAACLVTVTLFGAVAVGLTGEFGSDQLADVGNTAPAAVAQA